jgi:hypothetical protein
MGGLFCGERETCQSKTTQYDLKGHSSGYTLSMPTCKQMLGTLLLALLCTQTGCVTSYAWQQSQKEKGYSPKLDGVLRSSADHPGQPTTLVFSYSGEGESFIYVAIPLDRNGQVPAPFRYLGSKRGAKEMDQGLPAEQVAVVANHLFDNKAMDRAKGVMASPDYVKFKSDYSSPERGAHLRDYTIVAIGIRPDGTAVGEYPPHDKDRYAPLERFPDGAQIVLLPAHLHRSPGEKAVNTTMMVLVTPALIAFDLVAWPFFMVHKMFNC